MHKAIAAAIVALIVVLGSALAAHAAPLRGAAIGGAGVGGSALIPVWHWGVPHRTNCVRVCPYYWYYYGCQTVCRQQVGRPGRPVLRGSKRFIAPRHLVR